MLKVPKRSSFSLASHEAFNFVSLLRLARTENVGPISFFHLLKRYGSPEEALQRLPDIIRRAPIRVPPLEDIYREIDMHEKKGLHLISYYDVSYPDVLKSLKDPPPFITASGRLELLSRKAFAIVGSRNASQAGERLAGNLAHDLSAQKWVIISGLARGIDTAAHQASLEKGTIAVVAGGIEHIYPSENKKLYGAIVEKGLLISEDPLHQPPHGPLFLKRNRLISGLSWGVLVVEASIKSGALATAKYALDQGRSVFAVPGHPLDFRAKGCNKLLKQGAGLVENADDILSEYAAFSPTIAKEPFYDFLSPMDAGCDDTTSSLILNALNTVPIGVEELAHHLHLSVLEVQRSLMDMELNGEIERGPGETVTRMYRSS